MFLAAAALLTADLWRRPAGPGTRSGLVAGVVLGLLLAAACCTSNPPMPPAPKEPYAGPPDVCRRPFAPPAGS